jgi:hypothetical protein
MVSTACRDTFGRPIRYWRAPHDPDTTPAQDVIGIFEAAHQEVVIDAGVPVSAVRPILDVRLADLGFAPEQGDRIEAKGTRYQVVDLQPDGAGSVRCYLHRADD